MLQALQIIFKVNKQQTYETKHKKNQICFIYKNGKNTKLNKSQDQKIKIFNLYCLPAEFGPWTRKSSSAPTKNFTKQTLSI
jgi:hypothetical protein